MKQTKVIEIHMNENKAIAELEKLKREIKERLSGIPEEQKACCKSIIHGAAAEAGWICKNRSSHGKRDHEALAEIQNEMIISVGKIFGIPKERCQLKGKLMTRVFSKIGGVCSKGLREIIRNVWYNLTHKKLHGSRKWINASVATALTELMGLCTMLEFYTATTRNTSVHSKIA